MIHRYYPGMARRNTSLLVIGLSLWALVSLGATPNKPL